MITERYLWFGEMKNVSFSNKSYAASEVIGAIMLVLIAIAAFGVIIIISSQYRSHHQILISP